MENSKTQESSFQKQYSKTSDGQNRDNEGLKKKNIVNQRFILQSLIPIGYFYKTYQGIDTLLRKYVTVYLKPTSKQRIFSKNIKEELRQKITPPLLWSGTQKIDKNIFDVEVHLKFGPSLHEVMISYKRKIEEKTLYLLCYNLLKLIDRIDSAGYVNRSINLKSIILGENSQKNWLYFLNTFDFQRKGEEPSISYDPKYCSIGTHLKLKTSSKDTLQSMCYALMDFFLKGNLFNNMHKKDKQKDYLQAKTFLKPEGIPLNFIQFFEYVKNLNYGQGVKFTEWKIKFKKLILEQDYVKPYEWIQNAKPRGEDKSFSQASNILLKLFNSEISSPKNIRFRNVSPEDCYEKDIDLINDEGELEEYTQGQSLESSIGDKILQARAFNALKN